MLRKLIWIGFIFLWAQSIYADSKTSQILDYKTKEESPEVEDDKNTENDKSSRVSSEGDSQDTLNNKDGKDQEEEILSENEKNVLAEFLFNEFFPAFGGLEKIFLTNPPSFNVQFTQKGAKLVDCSLEFRLKQLRSMKYSLADIEIYDLQAHAEIGSSRWLFFEVACGEQNKIMNKTHFNFSFFVTNEEFKKAPYDLRVKLLNQEQLDIQFWSLQLQITIVKNEEQEILVGPHGNVGTFSEEYVSYKNESDLYDVPLSLWPALDGKLQVEKTQEEPVSVQLRKVKIVQTVQLEGAAQLTFPTYLENVENNTEVSMPVKGSIFFSEDGEIIPVLDLSMKLR